MIDGARRIWIEAGLSVVLLAATAWVAWDGFSAYQRADTVRDTLAAVNRNAAHAGRAESALLRGLGEAEGDPLLLAHLGMIKLRRGDLEGAGSAFSTLAQSPEPAPAIAELGRAVAALRGLEAKPDARVEGAVQRHISTAAKTLRAAAAGLRGADLLLQKKPERAREVLTEVIEAKDPAGRDTLVAAHANLALAAARMRDHGAEIAHLRAAILLSGGSAPLVARYTDAWCRRVGDPALEGEALDAALAEARAASGSVRGQDVAYQVGPGDVARILNAVGVAEARAGRLQDALRTLKSAYSKAPRSDPGDDAAAAEVATALRTRIARNLALLQRLLRDAEVDGRKRRGYAGQAGRLLWEVAPLVAERSAEQGYDLYLAAGISLSEAGFYAEATRALAEAQKLREGDVRLALAWATLFDQRRDRRKAIDWYQRALAQKPDDPRADAVRARIQTLELGR